MAYSDASLILRTMWKIIEYLKHVSFQHARVDDTGLPGSHTMYYEQQRAKIWGHSFIQQSPIHI